LRKLRYSNDAWHTDWTCLSPLLLVGVLLVTFYVFDSYRKLRMLLVVYKAVSGSVL